MATRSAPETKKTSNKKKPAEEPAWTYRGYRLKTSEFVTAMVHLFRAEIQRANVWRQRLDTTTNWAVVSTGATLSIAFSQKDVHHGIIILNTLLVVWFLFIEARCHGLAGQRHVYRSGSFGVVVRPDCNGSP